MLKGGRPDRLPLMPITTRVYETFVWSYEKKLVDGIHAAGGRVRLHICGNTRRILAGIGKPGCELVDLDYPVVLRQAREIMGPAQVLAGNIEPVGELRNGTPESVAQAVAKCHREVGPRYIVAAGCEVVRDTRSRIFGLYANMQSRTAAIANNEPVGAPERRANSW
jgi:uroporphyrinogen-III decarboxylase